MSCVNSVIVTTKHVTQSVTLRKTRRREKKNAMPYCKSVNVFFESKLKKNDFVARSRNSNDQPSVDCFRKLVLRGLHNVIVIKIVFFLFFYFFVEFNNNKNFSSTIQFELKLICSRLMILIEIVVAIENCPSIGNADVYASHSSTCNALQSNSHTTKARFSFPFTYSRKKWSLSNCTTQFIYRY